MFRIPAIMFFVFLSNCNEKKSTELETSGLVDTVAIVKEKTRFSMITFYKDKDLTTTPIVIPIKSKQGLDTLFSLIGERKTNTGCNLSSENIPVGSLNFYTDSLASQQTFALWFTLNDSCSSFFTALDKKAFVFELSKTGKEYLEKQRNRVERMWRN